MGGSIGEMETANARIRAAAGESEDGGTEAFFTSWCDMADRLRSLGDEDAAADRPLSAAEKYGRACVYYMTAERMQSRHYRPRQVAYGHMLEMADRWITFAGLACERVDIRYEGSSLPGLLATVPGVSNPPCMVFCNGLDSVKEMIYRCGIGQELWRSRLAREGDRPVPHYWDRVMWVWGRDSLEDFLGFAPQVSLVGVVNNITLPFLITHGAHDRQIPLAYAHQCYEEAVNSPKRELKIFTDREGGVEHCSADNMEPARSYIADRIARTFSSFPVAAR
jgi:pimeloyl-ACP methyl ester carboxylesterase